MDTNAVGRRLVELCQQGKHLDALALYAPDAVSVEATGSDVMPATMKGVDAIRGKGEWWFANHEIHRASARGPFPNGDRFAVIYEFEVTPKTGSHMETLAFYFPVVDGRHAELVLHWGTVVVPLTIDVP